MKKIDQLEKIIAAERQDNLDVLLRMENAISWDDLDTGLRTTYVEDIPYRRRVIKHLDYLLDCCQHWPATPPDVSDLDMARDLDDGLDWPEIMIVESIDRLSNADQVYFDYIRQCSRRWRLDHQR